VIRWGDAMSLATFSCDASWDASCL